MDAVVDFVDVGALVGVVWERVPLVVGAALVVFPETGAFPFEDPKVADMPEFVPAPAVFVGVYVCVWDVPFKDSADTVRGAVAAADVDVAAVLEAAVATSVSTES